MNLYLVDHRDDTPSFHDAYGDFEAVVVATKDETEALEIVDRAANKQGGVWKYWRNFEETSQVSLIGTTHITESKVILISYIPG